MNKKKQTLLMILGILGLIVITAGVTFAFFSYTKQGTTENTVTTGTITFLYTEIDQVGAGISLTNAFPISDEKGKALTGTNEVFDFKITSNTPTTANIPYEITARKKQVENMLDEEAVRIYLTKNNGTEEEVLLDNYSNLTQTSKVSSDKYIEKTLHTDKVPANSTNYEQAFRLRMWVDEEIDFSPVKDENGNDTYPYNNKEFTVTVNVYANAKVVTDEEIANESKAEISSLSVDGTELTKVEGQDYNYEASLPEGTTSTKLNIETVSEYATVTVEKLDSLAYSNSSIKRLSTSKTLQLTNGDNYFKVTVTSENKKTENEFILKISVKKVVVLEGFAKQIYDNAVATNTLIDAEPTLTNSSNNTNDASGLYKSTATNDESPTYYFRGNVTNNYVDFAGFTWRIVRINEDGTVRLIMLDGINNNARYQFNQYFGSKLYMYYSVSNVAKPTLETWYTNNIVNKGYSDRVITGNYFCEQAKVTSDSSYSTTDIGTSCGVDMALYSDYTPTFTCEQDANGKGLVNTSIGLITYDEILHAGGYYNKSNNKYYLYNQNSSSWTMSPGGRMSNNNSNVWSFGAGSLSNLHHRSQYQLFPVLNLRSDIIVTGTGTSGDHYKVQ